MRENLISNQRGSVINVALLILILLTLLGITFAGLSSTDIKISGNDRTRSMAFYAAEAARSYVEANTVLYSSTNVTVGEPRSFPDADDSTATQSLGTKQTFNGTVEYLGANASSRGRIPPSAAGLFKEHEYRMDCWGYGPANSSAESEVQAKFYRVGF